ncbi:MAG: MAPEG family protein [Myxococcota bacterium]|nr:MAPEG family protein [Myxococcota bacterium]
MPGPIETHGPVIWVTLGYLLVYYAFLLNGLRVKLRVSRECRERGERFDRYRGDYPALRASDRIQLNTLEHMPPFLVFLWLHAFVVGPASATALGWVYVLLRATYPLFLGVRLGRNIPRRLLINTFSGYVVLAVLGAWTAVRLV